MSSSGSSSVMSDPVKSALDHLKENMGFKCGSVLGKGTYGSVVEVTSSESAHFAAKIVEKKMQNDLETIMWPKLQHSNVLKLNCVIDEVDGVVIFLTEVMCTNLFLRLQCRDFKNDPNAIERCRKYARQVFTGISYLHQLNLCHLDLRAENVFLSADDRAVVADFSGLSWAEIPKKFCPLPHSLRPPEMLSASKKRVEPMPIDLWSCGLLLANLLLGKGFYVCTVKNTRAGRIEAVQQYTGLFKCEIYVTRCANDTYSSCSLTPSTVRIFINIVQRFLQRNPRNRLAPSEALLHPFFTQRFVSVANDEKLLVTPESDMFVVGHKSDDGPMQSLAENSGNIQIIISTRPGLKLESGFQKSLEVKNAKTKKWKNSRFWTVVRKFHIQSMPIFRTVTIKKNKKEEKSKKKKGLKEV